MSSKVSILWAICGLVEYALPPARWLLFVASASLPLVSLKWAEWICYGWAVVFVVDKVMDRVLGRMFED